MPHVRGKSEHSAACRETGFIDSLRVELGCLSLKQIFKNLCLEVLTQCWVISTFKVSTLSKLMAAFASDVTKEIQICFSGEKGHTKKSLKTQAP